MKRFLSGLVRRKKTRWPLIFGLLLLCLGIGVFAMLFEGRFIYFPEKYPGGMWEVQGAKAGKGHIVPAIEDASFVSRDGVNLHGWYCTPGRVNDDAFSSHRAEMVLLFFHGNAGNITHRYDMIQWLMVLPVNVFIIDYRGYGKSRGNPSEKGLYLDAQAAWNYLVSQRRIPPERVILFGESLGGAVAIDLATRVRPTGLIVQSSFTSIPDMAKVIFPFLPRFLVRTKMNSIGKISKVDCPKLFIHSPPDEVVPYKFGRRLFEAATEPKQFYEVPGASHNDTYLVGGQAYLKVLRRFVRSCAQASTRHPDRA
jgi:fermentation-respiration switch protein FrsA (DUF1100 family)